MNWKCCFTHIGLLWCSVTFLTFWDRLDYKPIHFRKGTANYPFFLYIWYILWRYTNTLMLLIHWKLCIAVLGIMAHQEQWKNWSPHLSKPKTYVWINNKSLACVACSRHPVFRQPDVQTSASGTRWKAIHTFRFNSKLH